MNFLELLFAAFDIAEMGQSERQVAPRRQQFRLQAESPLEVVHGIGLNQALAIVVRDKRASTSYLQRRLKVGYNKAATLIERLEEEGVISAPNHAGKREILARDTPSD